MPTPSRRSRRWSAFRISAAGRRCSRDTSATRESSTRSTAASDLIAAAVLGTALLTGCATRPPTLTVDDARQQVTESELAFARTMANRDLAAFGTFLAPDAVFLNGDRPLRGREA